MKKNAFASSAEKLLERIRDKTLDPAKDLKARQRKIIAGFIVDERPTITNVELGRIIGTTPQNAGKVRHAVTLAATYQFKVQDLYALCVDLRRVKQYVQRRCIEQAPTETVIREERIPRQDGIGEDVRVTERVVRRAPPDLGLFWRVEIEFTEMLQKFGLIYREPERKVLELPVTAALADLMKEIAADGRGIPSRSAFLARLKELASGDGHPSDGARPPRELPIFASLSDGVGEEGRTRE